MKLTDYHPFKSHEAKKKYLKLYDERSKQWPVPSETKMLDTSFGQTFVRINGSADAPPLVLVPGGQSSSLMWIPNIEALSSDYRTYALDNIYDAGRSVYSRAIKSPKDFAKWLDELFDALELGDNINVMGLSYGAWITAHYVLYYPERLNKFILLAPVATVQSMRLGFVVRILSGALPVQYFTRSFMYWLLEDSTKDEKKRVFIDEWLDDMCMSLKCFKFRLIPNPSVLKDHELESIKISGLYLVGENEKIYSPQKAVERLKKLAPNIKTEIIPNAGHDLTVAQTKIVNKKILEFLMDQ